MFSKKVFALSIERSGSFGGSSLEQFAPGGDSQEKKVKFLYGGFFDLGFVV